VLNASKTRKKFTLNILSKPLNDLLSLLEDILEVLEDQEEVALSWLEDAKEMHQRTNNLLLNPKSPRKSLQRNNQQV